LVRLPSGGRRTSAKNICEEHQKISPQASTSSRDNCARQFPKNVPLRCGGGYECGRIQGNAGAIRPVAVESSEKAMANPIKRAQGKRMPNRRVGAGLFAEGFSA
jgi:hypothetical protein